MSVHSGVYIIEGSLTLC